jgi:cell division septal protein FtsQ
VLYKVKKKRKTIKAIIAKAVIMFFLFVFLSGVIIIFYLSEKEQKSKINKVLNTQI